jgi:hypothetical protein
MLTDRIIGAFTFRKEVYAEVERDTSFTNTAWFIVIVVAFLNQFGSNLFNSFVNRIIGTAVGTVLAVVGFAVAAYIIHFVSRSLYNADVTFEELVRTLGLAYVWNVIGFVGILGAISPALGCLLAPALIVGVLLGLVAWFVAAKEALDLDWGETIISVIVGWIVMALISILLSGVIYSALGLTEAVARGLFGS